MSPPLGQGFGRLVTANVASSLGDGIARTAIPLLAARLTDDALLIAGIAAMSLLPWLFFAIPAGVVIDRIDRRLALLAAQAVRVTLAVLLIALVATDQLTIWWLYLVIFTYGAFETLYDGAVRAVLPSIVPRRNLSRANARIEAGEIVFQNFLAGPFTSALFAVAVLVPLGANAAAYLLAGVLALMLPAAASGSQHRDAAEVTPPWHRQLADGLRFIRGHAVLLKLWLVSVGGALCFAFAVSSLVLYVLRVLELPEAAFGFFMLSGGVGALAGSMVASRLGERFGTGPVMAAMMLSAAVSTTLIGATDLVAVAVACMFLGGLVITVWNIQVMSLRQALVPGRLLGRVHGTWRTLLWGTMPLGSLLGGLAGRIDLALPFLLGGGAYVVLALVYYRFIHGLPNPEDVATE